MTVCAVGHRMGASPYSDVESPVFSAALHHSIRKEGTEVERQLIEYVHLPVWEIA